MISRSAQSLKIAQKITEKVIFFHVYYVVLFALSLGEFIHITLLRSIKRAFMIMRKGTHFFIVNYFFVFITYLAKKSLYLLGQLPIIISHIPRYYSITKRNIIGLIISIWKFIRSKYFTFFTYGFITCFAVLIVYQLYVTIAELPSPRYIGEVNFAQSTHLYDRNGKQLYEIYKDINRTSISLNSVPDYLPQATIAIEDKNFYRHNGISIVGGVLRALKDTAITKELQGGSTITQQLVKSALLTQDRTIDRKVKEMIIALWAEQIYEKDEILEMYLNQVSYGGESYGVEQASQSYFGKSTSELSLGEAALLAGLPRAPSIYSPFVDPVLARKRRNQVLYQMKEEGYITQEQYTQTSETELNVIPLKQNIRAPHFVMYTRALLEQEYGTQQVQEAGFRVHTTLDLTIQQEAERILQEEVGKLSTKNVSNGGIVVMNPNTGEILAMVGSVDFFAESNGAFNVTTALRQPGSTLKPMLYAMALENGYTAASPIDDTPIVFQNAGSDPYRPVNYDGRFHGRIPIRYALANSYNIPAVKVLNALGIQPFVDYAKTMGIDTWQDPSRFGLSLSLGGGEVTLVDLVQVFSVFANGGNRVEPTPIRTITDYRERTVEELNPRHVSVMDPGVAYIISDILADNDARSSAFGRNSSLMFPKHKVSAKTGTTNDYKDGWTVGYTPEVVVGVWLGNNDNTPMHELPGSIGAGVIFNKMMTFLLTQYDMQGERVKPENVVSKPCYAGKVEYFISGTEKNSYCYKTIPKPSDTPPKEEPKTNQ
ncbi:MAG: PBP1A family penicillin-binding protein [bacterium]|nr:PBP1A family penicillin-binding protein [bacterium]